MGLDCVTLVVGWSSLIGRGLSRLCSDCLVLLRLLSHAIRVASMHGKVLLLALVLCGIR